MSVEGRAGVPGDAPPLPRAIWVVAWASLAGQALLLAQQGVQAVDGISLLGSVALGALVVGYVSAGVVRARTGRLVLAWVVLVLILVTELIGSVSVDGPGEAALGGLSLGTTVVSLAGLASFRRTEWYAWQRTKPPAREGAPIAQLIAIGVLVGGLGGLIGPVDDGAHVRISGASH